MSLRHQYSRRGNPGDGNSSLWRGLFYRPFFGGSFRAKKPLFGSQLGQTLASILILLHSSCCLYCLGLYRLVSSYSPGLLLDGSDDDQPSARCAPLRRYRHRRHGLPGQRNDHDGDVQRRRRQDALSEQHRRTRMGELAPVPSSDAAAHVQEQHRVPTSVPSPRATRGRIYENPSRPR